MTEPAPQPHGRLLARNTLLNLVGFGAPMLVALLAVPLLVSGLGTDRFGILTIAWILLMYLGELGFGSTTTRFSAEALGAGAGRDLGGVVWTATAMQGIVGLLLGAGLALSTPWLVEHALRIPPELWAESRLCLYLLAAALPAIGLAKSFRGVLEAGQRFDLVTLVRIPATVANYLLPVIGVLMGWTLPAVFGLILLSRIATLVAFAVLAVRTFPQVGWRPRLDRDRWTAMLGFGGWVTVSTVVSPVLVHLDRFLIAALLSVTALGHYAAPYELVARLLIVPMSVVATLFPAFSQLVGSGDRERVARLAARSAKAILFVLAPVALLLIGGAGDILRVWLGEEFARESGLALQILGVGVLVNAAAQVPYVLLQGSGRPDLPARFHLLELPIHAVVAWLLISRWGIPGAAAAWTLRVLLDAVLLFLAAHRLGLVRFADLATARVPQAAWIVLAALVLVVAPVDATAAARLGILALVVAGTTLAFWRYGFAPAERMQFATLFRSPALK
jgi:O-antigen/teichoic acid export membrane protein